MTAIKIAVSPFHLVRNTTVIQALGFFFFSLSHHAHHEGAPAGVSLPDGEAESHHRRDHRCVQRPPAVRVVPDSVEDQQAGIVPRVDHWADLNGQVDGGRAANHSDVGVL